MDNQRTPPSSRRSGRGLTPLPDIKTAKSAVSVDKITNKASNSLLSMQELQRRAQMYEKKHLRSAAFDGSRNIQVQDNLSPVQLGDTCTKKKGQKRRQNEMLGLLEAQEKMTEVAHARGLGKRNTLPGIGQNLVDASCSSGKLPKLQKKVIVENNAVDIISIHEASIRTAAKIKQISQDYMKEAAMEIVPQHSNNAPEVILQNEEKVGRAYKGMSYGEYARKYESVSRLDKRSREEKRSPRSPGKGN